MDSEDASALKDEAVSHGDDDLYNESFSGSDSDATRLYLAEIGFGTLLTKEEEYYYATRSQKGDLKAKNIMIESNLRLVVKIAKRYCDLVDSPEYWASTIKPSADDPSTSTYFKRA